MEGSGEGLRLEGSRPMTEESHSAHSQLAVLGMKAQNQKGPEAHPSHDCRISVCAAFTRKDLLSIKKSVNLYPSFAVFRNDNRCPDEFPGYTVPLIFASGPKI